MRIAGLTLAVRQREMKSRLAQASNPLLQRFCPQCGQLVPMGLAKRIYCSRRCNKANARKAWKEKRRVQLSGGRYQRFTRREIFRRDRFTCMLCLRPLAMNASAPHPDSPTLDHRIPLSRGGSHSRQNVQAAHFHCNSLKSDKFRDSSGLSPLNGEDSIQLSLEFSLG